LRAAAALVSRHASVSCRTGVACGASVTGGAGIAGVAALTTTGTLYLDQLRVSDYNRRAGRQRQRRVENLSDLTI
jgi:hypothetical protein